MCGSVLTGWVGTSRAVLQAFISNRDCRRFDLFGVALEEAIQESDSAIEDFLRTPPMSFGRT
jgi:hypothetical protein